MAKHHRIEKLLKRRCPPDEKSGQHPVYDPDTCTIHGNLTLVDVSESELELLDEILHIDGNLYLTSPHIEQLCAFTSLQSVEALQLVKNPKLSLISGFNSLSKITSLVIAENRNLQEIYGFNSLFYHQQVVSGVVKVFNNPALANVRFFRGLKRVNSSFYLHYNALETLCGLESLEVVGASFSLSANRLQTLRPLARLKEVHGMLGVVDNNLEALTGLERLRLLKTIPWNGSPRTIAVAKNSRLKDISALHGVTELDNDMIVYMDDSQYFTAVPAITSVFSANNIKVYDFDSRSEIPKNRVCTPAANDRHRFIDINSEFALDEDWRPGMKYYDYTALRGRHGIGVQLERIDLVRWADKIYGYHLLRENNIPSMPILLYSQRQNDDFFDKLEKMYQQGLHSFVVKASHLGNSRGVFRIRDGRFISCNQTASGDEMVGKAVDFNYLRQQIDIAWSDKQYEEEWACWMLSPGVILEELIEDDTELKFSIVFGELAGFFMRVQGFPTFDADGNLLSKNRGTLPHWWKRAKAMALQVARLVKADHIRIDLFYHRGTPVVNEITWNGGERREYTPNVVRLLNEGYQHRLRMLNKKAVNIQTDDYLEKMVTVSEFAAFSGQPDGIDAGGQLECKFLVVDFAQAQSRFYWMNGKRHRYHYMFYRNVLGRDCSLLEFDEMTYLNHGRRHIAGSVVQRRYPLTIGGREYDYVLSFWPTDPLQFRVVSAVWEMIQQRAVFTRERLLFHLVSELQQQQYESEKSHYQERGIVSVDTDSLMEGIPYMAMNEGEAYGELKFYDEVRSVSPRDIVVCNYPPNHLGHVAGIITNTAQTPLSHTNLLALQNRVPNAYIKGAIADEELLRLKNHIVHFTVSAEGYRIEESDSQSVEQHYSSTHPRKVIEPAADLRVKSSERLSKLSAADASAYGTKAANLGELLNLLPRGTVPDGEALPFYYYHAFMEHNGFYQAAKRLIRDIHHASDQGEVALELKRFRKKLRKGAIPSWMRSHLQKIVKSYPDKSVLRCRSSTNNEDLAGFSGAGLYDSYSHKQYEQPLAKTLLKVWSSVWNARAFEEREFYNINHLKTMMGVVIYPRYRDERANGIGVTKNIFNDRKRGFYLNLQPGELLVTNPESESIPEEILVVEGELQGKWVTQYLRHSNRMKSGTTILKQQQLDELISHLEQIHDHFLQRYDIAQEERSQFAMEVEFKVSAEGRLCLKQARPWVSK
ncbi:MAG: hypothetical protein HQL48_00745 [Gammaproteobacteria bacterium]|nr:hypothetical protein [Gammaproteobacteria bacterium]